MKFDINNPAFLQAAGSVSAASSIVVRSSQPEFRIEINRNTGGTVVVTRTVEGESHTNSVEIDSSGELYIIADQGTNVTITGDITSLTDEKEEDIYASLEYLDISKCKTLTEFSLGSYQNELSTIRANITNDNIASGLVQAVTNSQTPETLYLKSGSLFNQQVSEVAEANGWNVVYF